MSNILNSHSIKKNKRNCQTQIYSYRKEIFIAFICDGITKLYTDLKKITILSSFNEITAKLKL